MSSAPRVMRILQCLAEHDDALTQVRIAALTQLPRSTIQHLLRDLGELDFVEVDHARRYMLGPAAWALAASAERGGRAVLARLRPVLEQLAARTGETTILSVVADGAEGRPQELQVMDWAGGDHAVQLIPTLGPRPLGSDAASQVFLAFGDRAVGPRRPPEELATIRARGFAIQRNDQGDDVTSIAAPVFDALGSVAAAVTVAGPTLRMGDPARTVWPALDAALRAAAQGS